MRVVQELASRWNVVCARPTTWSGVVVHETDSSKFATSGDGDDDDNDDGSGELWTMRLGESRS